MICHTHIPSFLLPPLPSRPSLLLPLSTPLLSALALSIITENYSAAGRKGRRAEEEGVGFYLLLRERGAGGGRGGRRGRGGGEGRVLQPTRDVDVLHVYLGGASLLFGRAVLLHRFEPNGKRGYYLGRHLPHHTVRSGRESV